MKKNQIEKFRAQLQELAKRVQGRAESAEEQARSPIGGDSAGNLSNAPMHLADLGTEAFTQELGATLLENERYIHGEILAALERIDNHTFGRCENCRRAIAEERLEAIPYARHCATCAAKLQAGRSVNLNAGRPQSWAEGVTGTPVDTEWANAPNYGPEAPPAEMEPVLSADEEEEESESDTHAIGTPGGGTGVGGLAGTNIGSGDPDNADLERAMGSGSYDVEVDEDSKNTAYSGLSGGAVGGTPAGKRASGGKTGKGIAPESGETRTP